MKINSFFFYKNIHYRNMIFPQFKNILIIVRGLKSKQQKIKKIILFTPR